MFRVLLISDNPTSSAPLKAGLADHGLQTSVIATPELFQEEFQPGKTDVVILDLEQSRTDLHKICHWLKREPSLKDLPLILLVPEAQLGQVDYSWGVDDYLTS